MSDFPSPRRGRAERLAVALFCLALVLVPPYFGELYPFSVAPMFSDAPQCYCRYRVTAAGRELPLADFGLQRNYWGNPPGLGMGVLPPPTVDRFGEVAEPAAILEAVTIGLARHPEIPAVAVVQEVIGPLSDGSVGVVGRREWTVANPARPSEGRP